MSVDNIWDASTDTDGNTAANWSLNRVPIVGDIAVYDSATTDADCTFSGNFSCDGMRFDNAYAGTVDPVTHDPTLGTSGLDGTGGASATVNCGTGSVWTVSGDFNNADIGTWNRETSHFILDGVNKQVIGHHAKSFYDLTISGTIEVAGSFIGVGADHAVIVSGVLSLNQAGDHGRFFIQQLAATLDVSGQITGVGYLECCLGGKLTSLTGIIDCGYVRFFRGSNLWPTCQIDTDVKVDTYSDTMRMSNVLTVVGNIVFRNVKPTGNGTFDSGTHDPSFVVHGDVSFDTSTGGTITYTKGDGTWTFAGGNNQSIDLEGRDWEDIEIDKTGGTLTLTGNVAADSFLGTVGVFDSNGQTVMTVGACDWVSGFDFLNAADAMDSCSWIVGGNFTADSQTLQATASWTLTVTGTAVATGVDVGYSDASGGTKINATDGTNTNSGNNQNWKFVKGLPLGLLTSGHYCGVV